MANSALIPRLKTPGVYIEEISQFPPSVAQVPTAIPVFIGYTQKAKNERDEDLTMKPTRISSMLEYRNLFGGPDPEKGITVDAIAEKLENGKMKYTVKKADISEPSKFLMYYSLQWFYINGGGDCWIVSVGSYKDGVGGDLAELTAGLDETDQVDEITLFVFPDAQGLSSATDYYSLYKNALDKCVLLGDRFTIMDIWKNSTGDSIQTMRDTLAGDVSILKYGAAYYPNLRTNLDYVYFDGQDDSTGDENVKLKITLVAAPAPPAPADPAVPADPAAPADPAKDPLDGKTLDFIKPSIDNDNSNSALYSQAKAAIRDIPLELPPSAGIAGVYASVDSTRGVWKAPANVSLDYVFEPTIKITDAAQGDMNIDVNSGKSVNVIRSFTGKGPGIVWGARTLAGNDNEWRYISVRRFFNMVEESVKKATVQFVFEPNDKNTWVRVKGMIDNFLTLQWRAGALAGAVPEQAFYVNVGLNETMTALDILEGRMIVEIGMAVVRPAEFIILQFMHKMQES